MRCLDISILLLAIGAMFVISISIYVNFLKLFNNKKIECLSIVNSINNIPCKLRIERHICNGVKVGLGNKIMRFVNSNYIPYKVTDQALCLDKSVSFTNQTECFGLNKFVELFEKNNSRSIAYKFVNYNNPKHIVHLKFEDYIVAIMFKVSEYEVETGIYRQIEHGRFLLPFPSISVKSIEIDKISDYILTLQTRNISNYKK
jgi:hypothetical protein